MTSRTWLVTCASVFFVMGWLLGAHVARQTSAKAVPGVTSTAAAQTKPTTAVDMVFDMQARDVADLRKQIAAYDQARTNDMAELRTRLSAYDQQFANAFTAYIELAKNAQSAIAAQNAELLLVARTLSNTYGAEKWTKMVDKAKAALTADAAKRYEEAKKTEQRQPK